MYYIRNYYNNDILMFWGMLVEFASGILPIFHESLIMGWSVFAI
jgi:hypothetical protein